MSSALEDDLRAALHASTALITAAPDLGGRARAAVARRQRRRSRTALILAPVMVAAVVLAVVAVIPRLSGSGPEVVAADAELLQRPTSGDLAGKAAIVASMVRAYRIGVRPETYQSGDLPTAAAGAGPVGAPHVLWVGTTPTGPAAVVVQEERWPTGPVVAVGFLGTGAGGPTLDSVSRRAPGYDAFDASFVGSTRRTVLVLDRGERLTWSYSHTYVKPAGVRFADRPVAFQDGVAVLTVPAGTAPDQVAVTRPGPPGTSREVGVGDRPFEQADGARLDWLSKDPAGNLFPVGSPGAWPDPGLDGRYEQLLTSLRSALNAVPSDRRLTGSYGDDGWYAYGGTPDGRRLVATDTATLGDPTRIYIVLQKPGAVATVFDGGPVDRSLALPVNVPLPDGQGRLVARKGGRLSWGTDGLHWQDAGSDAALIPAVAGWVRLQVNGFTYSMRLR